ncbi:MAG: thiolase family protein [Chloroflexi bacterium]|nr:thiolase family protein [Chloroflexota bacterium]
MSLKGKAAIVGYGCTKPVRKSEDTVSGLMAHAAAQAIEDAGLQKRDIDGLLTHAAGVGIDDWCSVFSEYLQIRPTMASTPGIMGANGAGMVWRAAAAIEAGLCNYVLCVGGSASETASAARSQRGGGGLRTGGPGTEFDSPYGAAGAPSGYALVAQRHAHEYGTTDEQRARIAVDQRFNACANPTAIFYGQPITVDDVLNSRMISTPLHLLECVMPAIGAVAYVITSAERAKTLRHPPVYLLGAGECISHGSIAGSPRMTESPGAVSARRAFEMAGVRPGDINMASIYDCFTITVMITLEDAGFCKKGESGPWVQETDLTYKGKLPVNTHGGQLSWGQPVGTASGGMTHVMDATEQLMGRAGERQVPNCELAFVEGNGGILGEHASLILGRHQS